MVAPSPMSKDLEKLIKSKSGINAPHNIDWMGGVDQERLIKIWTKKLSNLLKFESKINASVFSNI